ncbi:MAG: Coenzyme A biosynthesis bifunctional protein CoaBC [Phycisphaerae bacterium]|nr:Coenzyme A biosynthesis bifunctional protein CoaBC [Phycisphaerae bacterium]
MDRDLTGYEVILGVSGGIAAYKAASVCSALVQRGCGVSVVMTAAAQQFVTPLTFRALTDRKVHTDMFDLQAGDGQPHIHLSQRADLIVIAPATAHLIAEMAHGLAGELLPCLCLSADCPILIAPTMNDRMWAHPAVQENVKTLADRGVHQVGPEAGWLACRTVGAGRMSDPAAIVARAADLLKQKPPRAAV